MGNGAVCRFIRQGVNEVKNNVIKKSQSVVHPLRLIRTTELLVLSSLQCPSPKGTVRSKSAIFLTALLAVTVQFSTSLPLYVEATVVAAEEPSVENSEATHFVRKSTDRGRVHVPPAKKYSCHGRKCELDLAMIDLSATETVIQVF